MDNFESQYMDRIFDEGDEVTNDDIYAAYLSGYLGHDTGATDSLHEHAGQALGVQDMRKQWEVRSLKDVVRVVKLMTEE